VEVASSKTKENVGLYTVRGKRGFFFELLPELARSGRVRLSFLRVDDHPVAWQLELLESGHSYLHHLAYDEAWKKVSPGKQLLHYSMECCWEEGRVFDFLPAIFAYKEKYANHSEPAHELHWIQKSLRGRIARRLIRWNMEWREKMRQRSPGLAANVAREQVSKASGRYFQ
jgi:CelD/BcsL family acetyltransferase involved in cellulose biosynthesis